MTVTVDGGGTATGPSVRTAGGGALPAGGSAATVGAGVGAATLGAGALERGLNQYHGKPYRASPE